ncbi:MAG: acyltransferase [Candidatus Acidiferrales bacterium]
MLGRRKEIRSQDPLVLLRGGLVQLYSFWVTKTYPFASVGKNLSIHYRSDVSKLDSPRIKLGHSVVIEKDTLLRVQSLAEGEPIIAVGDGAVIGARTIISAKNFVCIERDVEIEPSVLIVDHGHAYRDVGTTIRRQGVTEGGRIRIGEGCYIGQGSVIHCDRDELTLGRNCVVAPNSLVNRSFPPCSVIAGNPAHVVKQYDAAKCAWVLGSSRPAGAETTPRPSAA